MTPTQPLGRGLGSLIPSKRTPPVSVPVPAPPTRPLTSEPVTPRPPFAVPPSALPEIGGKHVSAAVPSRPLHSTSGPGVATEPAFAKDRLYDIPVTLIDPNPHQPRHQFSEDTLDDLVSSIRQHGIIQPLIVTRAGERYQLVAGERRFRAAQRLGLPSVPAIVRATREIEQLELAIIENVQRQDLNPIEEAFAYQQLGDEFGLTQEDIAKKVGKRRTTVSNALRLLSLPPDMQQALRDGRLTSSHAKILLSAVTPDEREVLFQKITSEHLPVRAAAHIGQQTTVRRYTRRRLDPLVQVAEDDLRSRLGTKVKITKREHRGTIGIEFYSDEDYDQLISRLTLI